MKTTQEMIKVMEAYENDKEIEMYERKTNSWKKVHVPMWNWAECDYRVKPEPTRLEVANKFWEDTFGIENNFNEESCPAKLCKACPLRKTACEGDDREKWWNTPMELKDGDKDA